MKYSALIKDYFTFNRKEQRGIIVLISLIFLLVIGNQVLPSFILQKPFDTRAFEKEILNFEKELAVADAAEKAAYQKKYQHSGKYFGTYKYDSLKKFPEREVIVIEINSADTFDLQQLRGIGPGFAKRIVKYREKLGGFVNVSQVREVFGMDEERYNSIKASLTVNPDSVHPIDLNNVTFKGLLAHPYFPFAITKGIMIYRKDHKLFKSMDELTLIPGICDSIFRKIRPYIMIK